VPKIVKPNIGEFSSFKGRFQNRYKSILGQGAFDQLIKRVANLFEMSPKELLSGGKHTRAIEKNEYIPTDSESIRGARSENRPHGKGGVSGMTEPIIQWTPYPGDCSPAKPAAVKKSDDTSRRIPL
jgi:hypothetical protein